MVVLGAVTERAKVPSSSRASSASTPGAGTRAVRVRRPLVRVPVLSVHTTSTRLTASTALVCWTSAPRPAMRAAPTAYATAMRKNSP